MILRVFSLEVLNTDMICDGRVSFEPNPYLPPMISGFLPVIVKSLADIQV